MEWFYIVGIVLHILTIASYITTAIEADDDQEEEQYAAIGQVVFAVLLLILEIILYCTNMSVYEAVTSKNPAERAQGPYKCATGWGVFDCILNIILIPFGVVGAVAGIAWTISNEEANFWYYYVIIASSLLIILYLVAWVFSIDLLIKGCRNYKAYREIQTSGRGSPIEMNSGYR